MLPEVKRPPRSVLFAGAIIPTDHGIEKQTDADVV